MGLKLCICWRRCPGVVLYQGGGRRRGGRRVSGSGSRGRGSCWGSRRGSSRGEVARSGSLLEVVRPGGGRRVVGMRP